MGGSKIKSWCVWEGNLTVMITEGYHLAIDFGTTNSVVARQASATAAVEIVAIPNISSAPRKSERPLIPSLL